jgi:hypothetical protein
MTCAVLVGWALGRLARSYLTSMGLLARLTEARGAVPLIVLAPIVTRSLGVAGWLSVGLVVGLYQGVAVARWIGSRGGWVPSIVGGLALGQSRVALAARRAAVRGAVWVTIAQTALLVVTLEAVLALFELTPRAQGLGAAFVPSGSPAARAVAICTTVALVLIVDFGSARLLRNGR